MNRVSRGAHAAGCFLFGLILAAVWGGDSALAAGHQSPEAEVVEHQVREGDTLAKIALEHYGRASLWQKLAKANNIPESEVRRLSVGQRIRLPGKARARRGVPERGRDAGGQPPARPAPARQYTVRAGDTLCGIARSNLGDATKWQILHQLNREAVPDPSRLVVGTVLKLP